MIAFNQVNTGEQSPPSSAEVDGVWNKILLERLNSPSRGQEIPLFT
jgi:hypothetical protein